MKNQLRIMMAITFLVAGCAKARFEGDALIVTHSPNPSNINTSEYFPNPPYPYTWYYRTEVRNNSDRELKVVWFEAYGEKNDRWYGSNVLNRTLRKMSLCGGMEMKKEKGQVGVVDARRNSCLRSKLAC